MTSANSANPFALVADIGGTNTRVGLAQGADLLPTSIRRFANREFSGLAPIIRAFLGHVGGVACGGVCVAAAGPVRNDVALMTNLDWTIDKPGLAQASGAKTVAILNDLQAQGHALGYLDDANLKPIITGPEAVAGATRLVIGVGTGFNAAAVFETTQGRLVMPSECGHANLPIRNTEQMQLSAFIEARHGFPGVEEVLSGRGLERIYLWLSTEAGRPHVKSAAEIMASANAKDDSRATKAVRVFSDILATTVGNLALTYLPFGGVYLVGGVARALAPHLGAQGFPAAFGDKGRFSGFMENFSVSVVDDDYAALTGCAHHLAALMATRGA